MICLIPEEILAFFRSSRLYHTFLFVIPPGFDKIELVRQIAALILCRENTACGQCPACFKVREGIHPDIMVMGEKKSIAIEEVREISQQAHTMPWEGSYKIFLLSDVHLLREEAANALLKILEEPPAHTIFLLTAENEHRVIPTILSRCQIFCIGIRENAAQTLVNQYHCTPDEAGVLLALGDGTVASAMEIKKKRWEGREYLLHSFDKDPLEAGEKLAEMCGQGEEGRRTAAIFIDYLASFLRDVLIYQWVADKPLALSLLINRDLAGEILKLAEYSQAQIFRLLDFLPEAKVMIAQNVTLSLLWENIFLAITER